MDITPLIPAGRQVIETYGEGRFRISGIVHPGAVIVLPERTIAWAAQSVAALSLDDFAGLRGAAEILLLGCGPRMALAPRSLREALRGQGMILEPMDTGAACRTYNVLLSEGRRVAAALLPV
jgi:uncharacterized protein